MDWASFVNSKEIVRIARGRPGINAALMAIVQEIAEPTLAHWVRETNEQIASGRQLTLDYFY